ncbi:MAG: hypothetical protein AB1733_06345 [Thermodesulfobacteriota bacterium]
MSKKSTRKNTERAKHAGRIKSRLKKQERFRKSKFVGNRSGDEKMSEVVMRFVDPYIADLKTEIQWKVLMALALIAWNASLLPLDERKAMIDEHVAKGNIFRPEEAKRAIRELIERKDKFFSDYDQVLVSYDLTMTCKGPHLTVAFLRRGNSEGQDQ